MKWKGLEMIRACVKLAGDTCEVPSWPSLQSFLIFMCGVQTSLQIEFHKLFCMIAWKLKTAGKKKEKKEKSLGLNSHDISKHNYKAFNSLCHADRSTRWHHTQVRCLAQAKKKSHNKTPVPESSVHSVKKASTQNRLARSPRSCFTTLQLYTSAVSEHKTHYRAAGRVDRQQSVSAGQTHTGAVITNLILMQNKFFLFLFLIIKTDKYTHSVFLQNLKSG